jgi:hypothetical protein
MKTITLQQQQNSVARKYLANVTSSITHYQSNDGWVSREGSTEDPNGTTDITNTTDAQKATIEDLLGVFNTLNSLTRQAVIDSLTKAHANANGSTPPTTQKFRRRSR